MINGSSRNRNNHQHKTLIKEVQVVKEVPVEKIVYVDRPVEVEKRVDVPGPERVNTVFVDRPVHIQGPERIVYVDQPRDVIQVVEKPVPELRSTEVIRYAHFATAYKLDTVTVIKEGPERIKIIKEPVEKIVEKEVHINHVAYRVPNLFKILAALGMVLALILGHYAHAQNSGNGIGGGTGHTSGGQTPYDLFGYTLPGGSLNIQTLFDSVQGSGLVENSATFGVVNVPSASTVYQSNAISGYIVNNSATNQAVGGYFQAIVDAVGGHSFGDNPVCKTTASVSSEVCTGEEVDVNASNTSDNVTGINVTGFWYAQPGTGIGVEVTVPGNNLGTWTQGFAVGDGAVASTNNAMVFGLSATQAANLGSSQEAFWSTDSGNTRHLSYHNVNALGQFVFTPYGNDSNFVGTVQAENFAPQSIAAGPGTTYFNDFYTATDTAVAAIGSPSGGNACGIIAGIDVNHPGLLDINSGSASGSGVACIIGGQLSVFTPYNSAWTWESVVRPITLPGTQAGSYQIGMPDGETTNIWTNSLGFNLSSGNGVANDWYCMHGSTLVDSTVAATLAFHRLTMVNNLTNLLYYVDGVQVCSVAVGSLPTTSMMVGGWASTALTGTAQQLYVDYMNFNQQLTR
jgi:hypothetical protein